MMMNKFTTISNDWLRVNNNKIEYLKRQCVDCQMRGSYEKDIDLNGIVRMFSSLEFELNKTAKELDATKSILESLKNDLNEVHEGIKNQE